jgi:hypothetical protein
LLFMTESTKMTVPRSVGKSDEKMPKHRSSTLQRSFTSHKKVFTEDRGGNTTPHFPDEESTQPSIKTSSRSRSASRTPSHSHSRRGRRKLRPGMRTFLRRAEGVMLNLRFLLEECFFLSPPPPEHVMSIPPCLRNLQRKFTEQHKRQCYSPQPRELDAFGTKTKHDVAIQFDPCFVHSHHACDGCDSLPIRGYRWRAVRPKRVGGVRYEKELDLPTLSKKGRLVEVDYDLCHSCYTAWRDERAPPRLGKVPHGVKFYSAQLGMYIFAYNPCLSCTLHNAPTLMFTEIFFNPALYCLSTSVPIIEQDRKAHVHKHLEYRKQIGQYHHVFHLDTLLRRLVQAFAGWEQDESVSTFTTSETKATVEEVTTNATDDHASVQEIPPLVDAGDEWSVGEDPSIMMVDGEDSDLETTTDISLPGRSFCELEDGSGNAEGKEQTNTLEGEDIVIVNFVEGSAQMEKSSTSIGWHDESLSNGDEARSELSFQALETDDFRLPSLLKCGEEEEKCSGGEEENKIEFEMEEQYIVIFDASPLLTETILLDDEDSSELSFQALDADTSSLPSLISRGEKGRNNACAGGEETGNEAEIDIEGNDEDIVLVNSAGESPSPMGYRWDEDEQSELSFQAFEADTATLVSAISHETTRDAIVDLENENDMDVALKGERVAIGYEETQHMKMATQGDEAKECTVSQNAPDGDLLDFGVHALDVEEISCTVSSHQRGGQKAQHADVAESVDMLSCESDDESSYPSDEESFVLWNIENEDETAESLYAQSGVLNNPQDAKQAVVIEFENDLCDFDDNVSSAAADVSVDEWDLVSDM